MGKTTYTSFAESPLGQICTDLQEISTSIRVRDSQLSTIMLPERIYAHEQLEAILKGLETITGLLAYYSGGGEPGVAASLVLAKSYYNGPINELRTVLPNRFLTAPHVFFNQIKNRLVQQMEKSLRTTPYRAHDPVLKLGFTQNEIIVLFSEQTMALFKVRLLAWLRQELELGLVECEKIPEYDLNQFLQEITHIIEDYNFVVHQKPIDKKMIMEISSIILDAINSHFLNDKPTYAFYINHPMTYEFAMKALHLVDQAPRGLNELIPFLNPELLSSTIFSNIVPKLKELFMRTIDFISSESTSYYCYKEGDHSIDLGNYYPGAIEQVKQIFSLSIKRYFEQYAHTPHVKSELAKAALVNSLIFQVQRDDNLLLQEVSAGLHAQVNNSDDFEPIITAFNQFISQIEQRSQQKMALKSKLLKDILTEQPEFSEYYKRDITEKQHLESLDLPLPPVIVWSGYEQGSDLVFVYRQLESNQEPLSSAKNHLQKRKAELFSQWKQQQIQFHEHKNKEFMEQLDELLTAAKALIEIELETEEILDSDNINEQLNELVKKKTLLSAFISRIVDCQKRIEGYSTVIPVLLAEEDRSIGGKIARVYQTSSSLSLDTSDQIELILRGVSARERVLNTSMQRARSMQKGDSIEAESINEMLLKKNLLHNQLLNNKEKGYIELDYLNGRVRQEKLILTSFTKTLNKLLAQVVEEKNGFIEKLNEYPQIKTSFFNSGQAASSSQSLDYRDQNQGNYLYIEELDFLVLSSLNASQTIILAQEQLDEVISKKKSISTSTVLSLEGLVANENLLVQLEGAKGCFEHDPDIIPSDALDKLYYSSRFPGYSWWTQRRGVKYLCYLLGLPAEEQVSRFSLEELIDKNISVCREKKTHFELVSLTKRELQVLTALKPKLDNLLNLTIEIEDYQREYKRHGDLQSSLSNDATQLSNELSNLDIEVELLTKTISILDRVAALLKDYVDFNRSRVIALLNMAKDFSSRDLTLSQIQEALNLLTGLDQARLVLHEEVENLVDKQIYQVCLERLQLMQSDSKYKLSSLLNSLENRSSYGMHINQGICSETGLTQNAKLKPCPLSVMNRNQWAIDLNFRNELAVYLEQRKKRYQMKDFFSSDGRDREDFINQIVNLLNDEAEVQEVTQFIRAQRGKFPSLTLQSILDRYLLAIRPLLVDRPAVQQENSQLEREAILAQLSSRSPRVFNSFQSLQGQIRSLYDYGNELLVQEALAINNPGVVVIELANALETKLDHFLLMNYKEEPDPDNTVEDSFNSFKTDFITLLHSQDDHLSQHRAFWKPCLANLLIGVISLGIATGIQLLTSKISTGRASFFFDKTKRLKHIEAVHQSAEKLVVQPDFVL